MDRHSWVNLIAVVILGFGLIFTVGCDELFDEEDDDTNGDELHDSSLIGSWYRYSMTLNGENMYIPTKSTLNANGTGTEWTIELEDGSISEVSYSYNWTTEDGMINITDPETNEELWTSPYQVSSGRATFTGDEGYSDVYVKQTNETDPLLVGDWYFVSRTVDGEEDYEYETFTLASDGTGIYNWGEGDQNGTWFTNGTYVGFVSSANPNHDYYMARYVLSDQNTTLTLTFYYSDEEHGVMDHSQIVSVYTSEEPTPDDTELVGTWHVFYSTVAGVTFSEPFRTDLYENGTGTVTGMGDEETPYSESITWEASGSTLTIYNEDHELASSGSYSISGVLLTYTYEAGGEENRVDVAVKATGEHDTDLVGTWLPYTSFENGVYYDDFSFITLSADYTGVNRFEDEDMMEDFIFTWSTSSGHIIAEIDGFGGLAMVNGYTVSNDGNSLDFDGYNDDGERYTGSNIKQTGDSDPDLIGTWVVTSRTVNGVEDPEAPGVTMIINADGTGFNDFGEETINWEWSTNSGYILVLMEGMEGAGHAYAYEVDGSTMTITYLEEDGGSGAEVVEVCTKE